MKAKQQANCFFSCGPVTLSACPLLSIGLHVCLGNEGGSLSKQEISASSSRTPLHPGQPAIIILLPPHLLISYQGKEVSHTYTCDTEEEAHGRQEATTGGKDKD